MRTIGDKRTGTLMQRLVDIGVKLGSADGREVEMITRLERERDAIVAELNERSDRWTRGDHYST